MMACATAAVLPEPDWLSRLPAAWVRGLVIATGVVMSAVFSSATEGRGGCNATLTTGAVLRHDPLVALVVFVVLVAVCCRFGVTLPRLRPDKHK